MSSLFTKTREWLNRLCNTVRENPNTVSQNPNAPNTVSVNALNEAKSLTKGYYAGPAGLVVKQVLKQDFDLSS